MVRLVCDDPLDLSGVIVVLTLSAGRKNPYHILFPKTDTSGEACLERTDLVGQFSDHAATFLMDYDGSLETAGPIVDVSLFDPDGLLAHGEEALAWPLAPHESTRWSSRAEQYAYRVSCRNPLFVGGRRSVDLERSDVIELAVRAKGGGADSA